MGDYDSVFLLQPGLDLLPQGGLLGGVELLPLLVVQVILHLLANGFQLVGGDTHILDGDAKTEGKSTTECFPDTAAGRRKAQSGLGGKFFLNIH